MIASCFDQFVYWRLVITQDAGPIVNTLSRWFNCTPKCIASSMDITCCIVQDALLYGAQVLIALGFANGAGVNLDAFSVMGNLG